jgi:nitrite reductase/ring-hydroxylating ferredoxin subunit
MSDVRDEQDRAYPDGRPAEEQPPWRQDFPVVVPADDALTRREFTKFLVLTSGAFAAGQAWIGAMSLLGGDRAFPEKWIVEVAKVPVDGVVEFNYPDEDSPCVLVRLSDERFVAYGQQCSHLSCAVIPRPEEGKLHCPCHHGYFEINEGRPIAGPPRRPLPRVILEVREGDVYAIGVELRTV